MNYESFWSKDISKWVFPKQTQVQGARNTDFLQIDWFINSYLIVSFYEFWNLYLSHSDNSSVEVNVSLVCITNGW